MPINTFEKYSLFGALDSDIFLDSAVRRYGAFSSHFLRAMSMNHNRLISKEELLLNLWWAERNDALNSDIGGAPTFGINASLAWDLLFPPIPILKLPGSTKADIRIRTRVGAATNTGHDATVYFQFATLANPFSPTKAAVHPGTLQVTANTSDGFLTYSENNVPLNPDGFELLEIWVRGDPTSNLAPTATYGSPNAGTLNQIADDVDYNAMIDASATWNLSGGGANNLADDGFSVSFLDGAGGSLILPPRRIVRVDAGVPTNLNGTRLNFDPSEFLRYPEEVEEIYAYGAHYQITSSPRIAISNICMWAQARSE